MIFSNGLDFESWIHIQLSKSLYETSSYMYIFLKTHFLIHLAKKASK